MPEQIGYSGGKESLWTAMHKIGLLHAKMDGRIFDRETLR